MNVFDYVDFTGLTAEPSETSTNAPPRSRGTPRLFQGPTGYLPGLFRPALKSQLPWCVAVDMRFPRSLCVGRPVRHMFMFMCIVTTASLMNVCLTTWLGVLSRRLHMNMHANDTFVCSYSLESGCWSRSSLLRSVDPELGARGLV